MNVNKFKRRRRFKRILVFLTIVISVLSVAAAVFFIFGPDTLINENIIYTYTTEAGTPVSPEVFTLGEEHIVRFADDVDIESLITRVGTHKITIVVDGMNHSVNLKVIDTVPPTAKAQNVLYVVDSVPSASDFVTDLVDVTKVKASFDRSPNMAAIGKQNVTIALTDEGGNTTTIDSAVYITNTFNLPDWELGTVFPDITEAAGNSTDFAYVDTSFIEDITTPGEHMLGVSVFVGGSYEIYYTKFFAKDSTPPIVTPVIGGIHSIYDELPDPAYWINNYVDATKVTFSYAYEYTMKIPGVYYIEILAEDEGKNVTTSIIKITAYDSENNDTSPVINIKEDATLTVGDKLDLNDFISIFDDKDGKIELDDTSKVTLDSTLINPNLPGKYKVFVTATDSTGNSSGATLTITVQHAEVSEQDVNRLLDNIISEIITAGMTDEQKILAVFNKIYYNESMDFSGVSDKENNEKREAYYGFVNNYGDSYTTSCMMKALLERLGIEVMTVKRTSSTTKYYWCLVDFERGWFHVDPFRKPKDWIVNGTEKPTFKLTDKELSDYTRWYNNNVESGVDFYLFDSLLYPDTPVNSGTGYVYNPYRALYLTTEGGYIDGYADQNVSHGSYSRTVSAVPASGYKFVGWSDGLKAVDRRDILKGDLTVTAIFEKDDSALYKKYKLEYVAAAGGTISGDAVQYIDSGFYGESVTAVAQPGYKFIGWSDGSTSATRKDLSKKDTTLVANFAPLTGVTYTLEYKAGLGGEISGNAFQIVEENGKGTAVTAVPDAGYVFSAWSDGIKTAKRTDKGGVNLSVTAYFVKEGAKIYDIQYWATAGGTIQGIVNQKVEENTYSEKVVAIANKGYRFLAWSDGITEPERSDLATSNMSIVATFEAVAEYNLIYMISGEGGYIRGEVTQSVYHGESASTVTAIPFEGYRFAGWSDGVMEAARTDMPTSNIEVTALFEKLVTYNVSYSAGDGGTINGSTSQVVIKGEAAETVVAVPNSGYKFVRWSDGVTTAERTDIITADLEVSAIFEAIPKYTITYKESEGGKINGTLTQTAYEGESYEAVEAIPDDGYEFVKWSDGVTDPVRTDISSEDKEITAIFNLNPEKFCTIIYSLGGMGGAECGTIQGELNQTVLVGKTTSAVTAVANEGYVFVKWSDGKTEATRSDVASENYVVYTAEFAPIDET